jgi:hypothetical protein
VRTHGEPVPERVVNIVLTYLVVVVSVLVQILTVGAPARR